HPSLIDIVLLLARLPQADCIVKTAARTNPFMRGIVTSTGYLANDHGDVLVDACADRIRRGRSVVLFPEGTRSPRGGLGRFQRGGSPPICRRATNDGSAPMRPTHEWARGLQG